MKELLSSVQTMRGSKVVVSICEELIENIATDSGANAASSFRMFTRRFIREFGYCHIRKLTLQDMQAFKRKLKAEGLSPATINHYVRSGKRVISYSIEMGYRPYMPLSAVKDLRISLNPQDKSEPPEYVKAFLSNIGKDTDTRIKDIAENVQNHLYLSYLTAMRPSELLRIVNDEGSWESENVFVPTIGKTNYASRFPRRIVLTETAMSFLSRCKPHWSDLSTFAHSCKLHAGRSSHFLRHSAGQAMANSGVSYQEVCCSLGHYSKIIEANSMHYFKPDWSQTVKALEVLPWTIGIGKRTVKKRAPKAVGELQEAAPETPSLRLVGY